MPFDDILDRHRDLKRPIYSFEILVKGSGFEPCKEKVLLFFQRYQLVRFSAIRIDESRSISALNPGFQARLQEAIRANRTILQTLIKELQDEKVLTLDDLNELPQGYKTKLLHIITHFLDGFFGIDTHFYNFVEDSHWVSDGMLKMIGEIPSDFWLLRLDARI
jgi:hypothetical protein